VQGVQGATGGNGTPGANGSNGAQGAAGADGAQGDTGAAGAGNQTYAAVQGAQFDTTSLTPVNIPGVQVDGLQASTTYYIDAGLGLQSSTSAGLQLAVQCTVAAATVMASVVAGTSSTGVRSEVLVAQAVQSAARCTYIGTTGGHILGTITTPASACSVGLQINKVTGGTAAVLAGSYLKLTKA
jgi:hypothetical protein